MKTHDNVVSLRILGSLFLYPPSHSEIQSFFDLISEVSLAGEWPFGTLEELERVHSKMKEHAQSEAHLESDYNKYFVGPNHLEAPPWGSAYLDKDNILFGASTLDLRSFLKKYSIKTFSSPQEPEDHFGFMMWYLAFFMEQEQDIIVNELLSEHILPWSGRYLKLLQTTAEASFYSALAQLASITLKSLQEIYSVVPVKKELYI